MSLEYYHFNKQPLFYRSQPMSARASDLSADDPNLETHA